MVTLYKTPLSDCFQGIGYDKEIGVMRVIFSSGDAWDYRLPPDIAEDFQNAPSLGTYYHKHIKGQFDRVKIDSDEWNGLERRRYLEPVTVGENVGTLETYDGRTIGLDLQLTDYLPDELDEFVKRLAVQINATATIPTEKIQEVVDAGLVALGMRDRRKREEAIELGLCPNGCGHSVLLHKSDATVSQEAGEEVDVIECTECDCVYEEELAVPF